MDNLVQTYNNALPSDFCQHVIDLFESSNNLIDGIFLACSKSIDRSKS